MLGEGWEVLAAAAARIHRGSIGEPCGKVIVGTERQPNKEDEERVLAMLSHLCSCGPNPMEGKFGRVHDGQVCLVVGRLVL